MAQINLSQSQQLQLRQADQIKRLEEPQEATGDVVSPFGSQDTKIATRMPERLTRRMRTDHGRDS